MAVWKDQKKRDVPPWMGEVLADWWKVIRHKVLQVLRPLSPTSASDSELLGAWPSWRHSLGAGHWGVVYATFDPKYVFKVTTDPDEGAVLGWVHQDPDLNGHPGTVYTQYLGRLDVEVTARPYSDNNDDGPETDLPFYLVVREGVQPNTEEWFKAQSERAKMDMAAVMDRLTYEDPIGQMLGLADPPIIAAARAWGGTGNRDALAYYLNATRAMTNPSGPDDAYSGKYLAEFMLAVWDKLGVCMMDVKPDNIGVHEHDFSSVADRPTPNKYAPEFCVMDVGYSSYDEARPKAQVEVIQRLARELEANPKTRIPLIRKKDCG